MLLLSVPEVARRLSLHPETVRDYLRDGKMRGVKMLRHWKVEETEVAAFVERNGASNETTNAPDVVAS